MDEYQFYGVKSGTAFKWVAEHQNKFNTLGYRLVLAPTNSPDWFRAFINDNKHRSFGRISIYASGSIVNKIYIKFYLGASPDLYKLTKWLEKDTEIVLENTTTSLPSPILPLELLSPLHP